MARYSMAKPLGATAAAPHLSRRRRQLAPNAPTSSPVAATRALRLPALRKPLRPPPPLFPRPKLPVPTTSDDAPTASTTGESDDGKGPPADAAASPSSSGAGDVLRLMDTLRIPPDEGVYISLLRDCADGAEVAVVHAHIAGGCASSGLPLPLANRMLLSYAACGDIGAALKVFDEMAIKDGITWAAMVSAYSDRSFHHDAMRLFSRMCHESQELAVDCNTHAIVAVLRSCARAKELRLGEQVHALLVKKDRLHGNIGCSLLQLYCQSGRHNRAWQVLDMMRLSSSHQEPVPEASWTGLITACHRDGLLDDAMDVFRDMVSSGAARGSFSLSSILAVCAESSLRRHGCHGQQVHADTIKRGVDTNQFVMSGLVHMYAKHGRLKDAARAFEAAGGRADAACWNAMTMAYARSGLYREATRVMYQMKAAGMNPSEQMVNDVNLACLRPAIKKGWSAP